VPVGGSCTIEVVFAPVSAGTKIDSVLVGALGAASQTTSLEGLAITPPFTVSAGSIAFPAQAAGVASAAQTLTIDNTGALPLIFNGTSIAGSADFAVTASTCAASIPVGTGCRIAVTFKPPSSGNKTAVLTLDVGGGAVPRKIDLSGTGVVPRYTLSASTLVFGSQPISTVSAPQSVTLANTGTLPVMITSIGLGGAKPGDFRESNRCGSAVAVGSSCKISVTFAPPSKGTQTATLNIVTGGSAGNKSVSLSGVGTAAP
jgi:hypothetical protein